MHLCQHHRLKASNGGYSVWLAPNGHVVSADGLSQNRRRIAYTALALAVALEQLSYRPYHCWQMRENAHEALWTEALQARFQGRGSTWGREDFDHATKGYDVRQPLIRRYLIHCRSINPAAALTGSSLTLPSTQCVLDFPMTLLHDDLLAVYPEAHFILVTRPLDGWYRSVASTIFEVHTWRVWRLLALIDRPTRIWLAYVQTTWDVFCDAEFFADDGARVKEAGAKYNENVRKIVSRERLLEWSVQDGWNPLCEFLGKEVPSAPFPRVNDQAQFVQRSRLEFAYHCSGALARWAVVGTLVSILASSMLRSLVGDGLLQSVAINLVKGFGTVSLSAALTWTCLRWT